MEEFSLTSIVIYLIYFYLSSKRVISGLNCRRLLTWLIIKYQTEREREFFVVRKLIDLDSEVIDELARERE